MSPTNRTARDSDVLALTAPWLLFGRHGKEQLQPIVDTLCVRDRSPPRSMAVPAEREVAVGERAQRRLLASLLSRARDASP